MCLILRGDYHQSAKYHQSDIEKARDLHLEGVKRQDIAEMLEIPLGMVNQYVYFDRRVG
ncbi:DNA-binding protein [Salmonella enterica]|nr:DNA-binding protein [Salmonella enterica]